MSYAALYEFVQAHPVPISRRLFVPKVEELAGRKVKVIKSGLDISITRGFYIPCTNLEHPFVRQTGGTRDIVVLARDNNRCWDRFVLAKELMHMFDSPLSWTNSASEFEDLLDEFGAPRMERSVQMNSEAEAFWKALGLICPEAERARLSHEYSKGVLMARDIAHMLLIPEQLVPALFDQSYKPNLQALLK